MLYLGSQAPRRVAFARRPVLLAALGFALVAGGCDAISGAIGGTDDFPVERATETLHTGAVAVDEIDQGQYGDIVEGTRTVLRDDDAYASFWKQLYADRTPLPDRPTVDFENKIVIAVVLGQRPTGGYSARIDEALATESGGQIQVRHTEVVPGEECGVTLALTSPYVLAAVEAQDEEVEFSGSEKTRSC
jgi:hypothetical protein